MMKNTKNTQEHSRTLIRTLKHFFERKDEIEGMKWEWEKFGLFPLVMAGHEREEGDKNFILVGP